MRTFKWFERVNPPVPALALLITCGFMVFSAQQTRAQEQPWLRGIGDLPGGLYGSWVRDVTAANGVVYAVGAGSVNATGVGAPDMPVLWTFDGTNATLTALPNTTTTPVATSASFAYDITSDAQFIASQTRATSTGFNAVTVSNIGGVLTNQVLNPIIPGFSARSISDDGSVLYGVQQVGVGLAQVVRWKTSAPTAGNLVALLPGMNNAAPARGGTSSDGSIMVGTASVGALGSTNGRAFRYVHGLPTPVTALPLLSGGTWNAAITVTSDGRFTLLMGDSTAFPRGEYYVHDANSGDITPYGSPNSALGPFVTTAQTPSGGMSDTGVIIVGLTSTSTGGSGYMHNSNGWFHIGNVLAGAGIDMAAQGWDTRAFFPNGISISGGVELISGRGRRRDPVTGTNLEGFVAQLPAGYLENFDGPALTPVDAPIVGAWHYQYPSDPSNTGVLVLMKDGTYYQMSSVGTAPGFERGRYFWNAATGEFSIAPLQDTNGTAGLSDFSGASGLTFTVTGDNAAIAIDPSNPTLPINLFPNPLQLTRVAGGPGTIVGGWITGNASTDDNSMVEVLLPSGQYFLARDGVSDATGQDGIEIGSYSWDAVTKAFSVLSTSIDTNGGWALSPPPLQGYSLQLSADELQFTRSVTGTATRIVSSAEAAPVVIGAELTILEGAFFSYTIEATHAATYDAQNLPAGLTRNGAVISGIPTVDGVFNVTLSVTNGAGASAMAPLKLTITPSTSQVNITWPNPAGIQYGTSLGAAQLNAQAAVPGHFVYTPAAGTVLNAGLGWSLQVEFVPDDLQHYEESHASVSIDVAPAGLTVTAPDAERFYLDPDPFAPLGNSYVGLVNSDQPEEVVQILNMITPMPVAGVHDPSPEIKPTIAGVGPKFGNYILDLVPGHLVIKPRPTSTVLTTTTTTPSPLGPGPAVMLRAEVSSAGLSCLPVCVDGAVAFTSDVTAIGLPGPLGQGVAEPLPPGNQFVPPLPGVQLPLLATYDGGVGNYAGGYAGVSSPALTQVTVTSSAEGTQIATNKDIVFTATVTGCIGALCPDGIVQVYDGGFPIGLAFRDGATQNWKLTTQLTTGGQHAITAVYFGQGSTFLWSRGSMMQDSRKPSPTITTVGTVAGNPAYAYGQVFTVTALVEATASGETGFFGGIVTFYDGTKKLGSRGLVPGGIASISWLDLGIPWDVGTHTIRAVYAGNQDFLGSEGQYSQTINQATTQTSFVDTSGAAQSYTITVIPQFPNISVNVNGTVTVLATLNGTPLPAASLTLFGSQAFWSVPADLPAGQLDVSFTYSGSSRFYPSTGTYGINRLPQTTSTVLLLPTPSVTVGHKVDMTATVNVSEAFPAAPLAPNKVEFWEVDANGVRVQLLDSVLLNPATKKNAGLLSSTATLSLALTEGTHRIQAFFVPSSTQFLASSSNIFIQVVNPK